MIYCLFFTDNISKNDSFLKANNYFYAVNADNAVQTHIIQGEINMTTFVGYQNAVSDKYFVS